MKIYCILKVSPPSPSTVVPKWQKDELSKFFSPAAALIFLFPPFISLIQKKFSPVALFLGPFPSIIFKNWKNFSPAAIPRQTFLFVLIKRRNITKYESAGSKPVHFFSFCIDIEKRRNKKKLEWKNIQQKLLFVVVKIFILQ